MYAVVPRARWVLVIAVVGTLTACSSTKAENASNGSDSSKRPSASASATIVTPAPADEPVRGEDAKKCRPGPGKKVKQLPDVTIPAVTIPAVHTEPQKAAGKTVPGVDAPAIKIPQRKVDGGCIIKYDAPGGCLGAVEITGVKIPPVTIPKAKVPAVEVGGKRQPALTEGPVTVSGVVQPAVRQEQVCRQDSNKDDDYQPQIYRPQVYRPQAYRAQAYRPQIYRPQLCVNSGCVESLTIASVTVPSVTVESVTVPSVTIESRTLSDAPDVNVFEGDDQTAYTAPADVLFDFDSAKLGSAARDALRAIASKIENQHPDAELKIEGHTDSVGSRASNKKLSQRRAQAVADWFTANTRIPAKRITTEGYGETKPVAPNAKPDGSDNPEGRARNRRVVVTVDPE